MSIPSHGSTAHHRGNMVFNYQAALERLGSDENLFSEMAGFFLDDCPGLLEDVRRSVQERDAEGLQRAAHSLKGLVATFDAYETIDAAKVLEHQGTVGDFSNVEERVAKLAFEVQRLQAALEPYRKGEG